MQRDEIVKKVADQFGLTIKQVEDIVDSQNNFTLESMKNNLSIKLSRLGKFVPTANIRDYREGNREKVKVKFKRAKRRKK